MFKPIPREKMDAKSCTPQVTSLDLTASGGLPANKMGKTLAADVGALKLQRAIGEFLAVLNPPQHVFAEKEQHAHFRIAAR